MLTPSFSAKAVCEYVESHDTPDDADAAGGEVVLHLIQELQLVGADRAEGERVEHEERALAVHGVLGEVPTLSGAEVKIGTGEPAGRTAIDGTTGGGRVP